MTTHVALHDATAPLTRSAWTHPQARPFTILGTIAVVGGGMLSAALAPTPSYHGSWAVAYIVLVAGVAQIVLGVAQASVTGGATPARTVAAEAVLFNLASIATVVATIQGIPVLLYAATIAQVCAIVLFLLAVRGGRRGSTLVSMRIVAVLLLIAAPTGIVLQSVLH